ncbi:ectoine synthase [Paraburkholderia megapolitana]|uniref:L-ectoine synthase n=1 Tax=Paraburkholderia megapolitana TaxID=420953 RepID=A0A1I3TRK7_9BURK|nr:ectoine synthase [Paraburkholderia megapolitana]QDQ83390.1 ectoine synthase [Paraburkholderia megapolitana]SFJ73425.1 ectoine synthase [Paraburkholderia megapolitana]
MIVRNIKDTIGTERHKKEKTWDSVRLLLRKDGMGFGFHITTMYAGTTTEMQYRHHLECVYCISGSAQIKNVATQEIFPVEPGMMYALNQHDHHIVTCETDIVIACTFSPALNGDETHGPDGAYPASD